MLKTFDIIETFEYKLIFNKDKAKYYKEEKLSSDNNNSLSYELANILDQVDGDFFSDMVNSTSVNAVDKCGKIFLITKSSKDINWYLSKENKIINNQVCF